MTIYNTHVALERLTNAFSALVVSWPQGEHQASCYHYRHYFLGFGFTSQANRSQLHMSSVLAELVLYLEGSILVVVEVVVQLEEETVREGEGGVVSVVHAAGKSCS